MSKTLLNGAGASITGEWVLVKNVAGDNPERPITVYCWGTFDGNMVTLQVAPGNSDEITTAEAQAFAPADGTFTEAGAKTVTLSAHKIRLVTDATGSPVLYGVVMS